MKRKKNKEFAHIGKLVENIMEACQRELPDSEMTRIFGLWEYAMGKRIAENTRPAAFKGNLLLVNVVSSPWMQQLQFLKNDIINNINTALGKELVREIRFKIGPV